MRVLKKNIPGIIFVCPKCQTELETDSWEDLYVKNLLLTNDKEHIYRVDEHIYANCCVCLNDIDLQDKIPSDLLEKVKKTIIKIKYS